MTRQEKNVTVGLASLLVLIVTAHLIVGSPTSDSEASTVTTEPAPQPIPTAQSPGAPEPREAPTAPVQSR